MKSPYIEFRNETNAALGNQSFRARLRGVVDERRRNPVYHQSVSAENGASRNETNKSSEMKCDQQSPSRAMTRAAKLKMAKATIVAYRKAACVIRMPVHKTDTPAVGRRPMMKL